MTHLIGSRPVGCRPDDGFQRPTQPKPRMLRVGSKSWGSVIYKMRRLLIIYSSGEKENSPSRPISFPSQTSRIVFFVCSVGYYSVKVSEEIHREKRLVRRKLTHIQMTNPLGEKGQKKKCYKIPWSKPTSGKSII